MPARTGRQRSRGGSRTCCLTCWQPPAGRAASAPPGWPGCCCLPEPFPWRRQQRWRPGSRPPRPAHICRTHGWLCRNRDGAVRPEKPASTTHTRHAQNAHKRAHNTHSPAHSTPKAQPRRQRTNHRWGHRWRHTATRLRRVGIGRCILRNRGKRATDGLNDFYHLTVWYYIVDGLDDMCVKLVMVNNRLCSVFSSFR